MKFLIQLFCKHKRREIISILSFDKNGNSYTYYAHRCYDCGKII